MKNFTSTRGVYLLISVLLSLSFAFQEWYIVLFVALMLSIGVITGFCPSKWMLESLGFKKTEL